VIAARGENGPVPVYSIIFLALVAFVSCLVLTPLVRIVSRAHGLLDHPNARKLHASPVPRTGGVAIAGACVIATVALLLSPLNGASAVDLPLALRLLPAVGLVFLVGLADDLFGLKPWHKLLGQVAAACLAYYFGVEVLAVAGYPLHHLWSLPLTVVWLVACSNAFNLIDGVDGLATGVGLFAAFTTLSAALITNNAPLALATAPLVGALLAFLRYNFNPASIFMGDSGSLTIGFALGCFGAIWSHKSTTLLGMTAPLMALAVPLLDTGIAVVRRFIRRQPVFSADRNHAHHRLLDRGLSPRNVALVMYGACGVAAGFSILLTMPGNTFNGVLLIAFCVVAVVAVQMVRYSELDVASSLVMSGAFRDIVDARMCLAGFERRMDEAVNSEDYWEAMHDISRDFGFLHIRMSLGNEVYEDQLAHAQPHCFATMRIPLAEHGYVNVRFPSESSVRHAIAITSLVDILQRSLLAKAGATAVGAPIGYSRRPRPRLVGTQAVGNREAIAVGE
jgi:UDP-GlcNAc:undecaprenyl-phosphate GlcNAc-1-phosphate transferase